MLLDEEYSGEYRKKLFPKLFLCNCAANAFIFAIHSWKLTPTNRYIFSKRKLNFFQAVTG